MNTYLINFYFFMESLIVKLEFLEVKFRISINLFVHFTNNINLETRLKIFF